MDDDTSRLFANVLIRSSFGFFVIELSCRDTFKSIPNGLNWQVDFGVTRRVRLPPFFLEPVQTFSTVGFLFFCYFRLDLLILPSVPCIRELHKLLTWFHSGWPAKCLLSNVTVSLWRHHQIC